MGSSLVTIIKEGKLVNVDESQLRQDDMVVIQAGDLVPADMKLVEVNGLVIDEFDITGEITPVHKQVDENDGMVYMGSKVIKGSGRGVVLATGEQIEYGKILNQDWETSQGGRFQIIKKEYFIPIGVLLPAVILILSESRDTIVVFVIYSFLSVVLIFLQNDEFFKHFLLTNELNKLKSANIQVRNSKALERFNAIDIICFDKTGVLTTREMRVTQVYVADTVLEANSILGSLEETTLRILTPACALCNDVHYYEKIEQANSIDKALIVFAQHSGVNGRELFQKSQRIHDMPFNSENRYMTSGSMLEDKPQYFAKGDPDIVLKICNDYLSTNLTKEKVDFNFWVHINSCVNTISQKGDTAIAVAYSLSESDGTPKNYTFLCLLQLENPLQPHTRETIKEISGDGIRSILLTGDKAETASKIGVESSITERDKLYLTGRTIARMDLIEVGRQAEYCSIFARLIPSQKGVLIRLLQQRNHTVAMVGDGPNDGIALKAADIGISFHENTSPIARRLSTILINDLSDLHLIIQRAKITMFKDHQFSILRRAILVVSIISMYVWALSAQWMNK